MQPATELHGANSSTNQTLVELFRYQADTTVLNRPHLVANISLYKDPVELSRLGFPLEKFPQNNAVRQFVFVTASDDHYFHVAMDAIARIQMFFPNHTTYFYDLSGGVLDNRADKVSIILCTCNTVWWCINCKLLWPQFCRQWSRCVNNIFRCLFRNFWLKTDG